MAGSALDPDPDAEEAHVAEDHTGGHEAARAPAGLALAEDGLRLDVDRFRLAVGRQERLGFRIVGEGGRAVRDFDVEHDRRMHLIVVRRDLTGFQHLHPEMAPDGTWSTSLELTEPGSYRVFADFKSGGASHTLGADVHVAGPFEPRDLPHPSDRAGTGDGYEVRLTEDDGQLRFTVYVGDRRVDDIEPYLGARGHMVALREGDLAFLHVHPEAGEAGHDESGAGHHDDLAANEIAFAAVFPTAGRYRLYLQFKHDGIVRTAEFTVAVPR